MSKLDDSIVMSEVTVALYDALVKRTKSTPGHILSKYYSRDLIPNGKIGKGGIGITQVPAWRLVLKKTGTNLGRDRKIYARIFEQNPHLTSLKFANDTIGLPLKKTRQKLTNNIMRAYKEFISVG